VELASRPRSWLVRKSAKPRRLNSGKYESVTMRGFVSQEPDSHFKKLLTVLDRVEEIGVDGDAACLIDDARDQVKRAVETIEERKRERDKETEDDTDWTHIVTQRKEGAPPIATAATKRSVFDDVDK
jgi:hypothetical protein